MVHKEKQSLAKPVSSLSILLAIATVVSTGIASYSIPFQLHWSSPSDSIPPPTPAPKMTAIAALGRLEPQGEVIHLSAPSSLSGGVRVAKLMVSKGDKVHPGQVVAILDSYQPNLAALEKAKRQVEVAEVGLKRVKAGAKSGDIYAQKAEIWRLQAELDGQERSQRATIARLTAQLKNAQIDNIRYQQLYHQGAIAAITADDRRLNRDILQEQLKEADASLKRTRETLAKQLTQAQARLKSVVEVRPTDVEAAEADLDSAKASVRQAEADLYLSSVRAPINGQVMKIHAWPGEIIGNDGIAEIGHTDQMYVVAEVYETDIKKVHLGQPCVITGSAFSGKLPGTVTDIGLLVDKQNIFTNNPGADTDNKIIDVKVRINNPKDNARVASLTNLQVQVLMKI